MKHSAVMQNNILKIQTEAYDESGKNFCWLWNISCEQTIFTNILIIVKQCLLTFIHCMHMYIWISIKQRY